MAEKKNEEMLASDSAVAISSFCFSPVSSFSTNRPFRFRNAEYAEQDQGTVSADMIPDFAPSRVNGFGVRP